MAKAAARVVGVPAATIRGWPRRFAVVAAVVRARFTVLAHELDPLLGPVAATGNAFADAVEDARAAATVVVP